MNDIKDRALVWLLGGDTGLSSETLCAHMLGIEYKGHSSPPSDSADRGRCIRLLKLIPEWQERLEEMADLKGHSSLVIDAKGMRQEHNSWAKQIPMIREELAK